MQLPIDLDKQVTDQLSQKENNQNYTQNLFTNQNNNLNTAQNKLQYTYTQNETLNPDVTNEMTSKQPQQHLNNEEIELTDGELTQNSNVPNVCTKKNGVVSCSVVPQVYKKEKISSDGSDNIDYKHIIYEYIVLPLTLVIIFAILTHPKSSLLLERYLPKMDSLKGVLIRGLLMYVSC
ncbi:MAG: hypothetical protein EOO44_05825 [Flavobacterium sp.]|nr:MAG: hypothetical protein EOO44_05825 [Flavobacterium sp.]